MIPQVPSINDFLETLDTPSDANTQVADKGRDTLNGSDEADLLSGGAGSDNLSGGQGQDMLFGGRGRDSLFGGDDADYIMDEKGSDFVSAGSGDDYVMTDIGKDEIYADEGNDVVLSGRGSDIVYGGEGDDLLFGGRGRDNLYGDEGADVLVGGHGKDTLDGGAGDDEIYGGIGADTIYSQFGNDVIDGGNGKDLLISRSDSGEPVIAQDPDLPRYYPNQPIEDADDVMTGGKGADVFKFRLDIDAKLEIAQKHADENGVINWRGVAGENDNAHDHWVNGIGNDTITDFNRGQGDTIVVTGHTVQTAVEHIDLDDDGTLESSRLVLYSDQGNNGGAHNQDKLGTVVVENALLTDADIVRDEVTVFFGAHETIEDLMMA